MLFWLAKANQNSCVILHIFTSLISLQEASDYSIQALEKA